MSEKKHQTKYNIPKTGKILVIESDQPLPDDYAEPIPVDGEESVFLHNIKTLVSFEEAPATPYLAELPKDASRAERVESFRMEEELIRGQIRRNYEAGQLFHFELKQAALLLNKAYRSKHELFKKKKEGKSGNRAHLRAWREAWKESDLEAQVNQLDHDFLGLVKLYDSASRGEPEALRDILTICPIILDESSDKENLFIEIRERVKGTLIAAFEDRGRGRDNRKHLGFILESRRGVKVPDFVLRYTYIQFQKLHLANKDLSIASGRNRYNGASTPSTKAIHLTNSIFKDFGVTKNYIGKMKKHV